MQIDDELYEVFRPWMAIFDVVFFRTKVGMNNTIKFTIENLEENPVLYGNYDKKEIRLALPSGDLVESNLPEAKLQEGAAWVQENSDYIIKRWTEDKLETIMIEHP